MRNHISVPGVTKHSQKTYLADHLRRHTGEKHYQCNLYDKAFRYTKNLAVHLMSHSGEKQYQYTLFGMSFSDSSYFIRHMRAHIEEKTKSVPTVTNHFQKNYASL